ncbi:MAG: HepT-like ribonuclease domain-containing protein [Sulfuritalea sp.]|nr:HepT-like ribonuclease domain-containing protein [Sulfuritalea sp.]
MTREQLRVADYLGHILEAIERTAPDFAARHSEIAWSVICTMCNRITHSYFKVDLEIVWRTIQRDLPELADAIGKIAHE